MFNRFKNIQVYASPPFALPEVAMVSRITVISSTGAQKMRASYPTRARFEPMFNRFTNIRVYASPPFALRAFPEVAMVCRIGVIFERRSAENARQLPHRSTFEPMFNRVNKIRVYVSTPFALQALPEVAMVGRIAVIFEHRSGAASRP
jgi:uncharacterized membrane protein YfbV (UPF0208 family)